MEIENPFYFIKSFLKIQADEFYIELDLEKEIVANFVKKLKQLLSENDYFDFKNFDISSYYVVNDDDIYREHRIVCSPKKNKWKFKGYKNKNNIANFTIQIVQINDSKEFKNK